MMYHCFYLVLLRTILAGHCEDICHLTLNVMENTAVNKLQWNLFDLLSNRTTTWEYLQFSLSSPSEYFEIVSPMLKYRPMEFDREKICDKVPFSDECSLHLQIFTQTSFVVLFQLIILDENDWKPFFQQTSIHLNIRENLPDDYRIQLPAAHDYDSSIFNIDRYEFLNNTRDEQDIFRLETSHDDLQLNLIGKLDCERKNHYDLFIVAIDKGGLTSNVL